MEAGGFGWKKRGGGKLVVMVGRLEYFWVSWFRTIYLVKVKSVDVFMGFFKWRLGGGIMSDFIIIGCDFKLNLTGFIRGI